MTSRPANERKHAVVVLGMHRSGTSAMARVVALAGAALPLHVLQPAPDNPEGFWEPLEMMALNERFLADLDTSWDDPFGPREARQRPIPWARYLTEAREVVARNYADAEFIVVKEPRATLLLDLWREALEREGYEVSYVIMVRRPDEVAQSLKTRNGTALNKGLITWTTYMLAADLSTRGRTRAFVSFDDLLSDPEEVLTRLESRLNVSFPRRTWESALQIQDFLKTDGRHHASSRWPRQFKHFKQIERFYAYLAASSRDEPWNADISDEVALWLSQLESVFGPILKQSERDLRQLELAKQQAEDALTHARDTNEAALSQLREAHSQREQQLGDSLAASLTEIEGARQRGSELEAALDALRERHDRRELEFSQELARTTAELEALRATLEGLRADRSAQEAELNQALSRTRTENAELTASLETQAREHEARKLQLTRVLDRALSESADLRVAVEGLGRAQETDALVFQRELTSLGAHRDELRAAIDAQAREHGERERELREALVAAEGLSKAARAEAELERRRTGELSDLLARAAQAVAEAERRRTSELSELVARHESREAEAQRRLESAASESERMRAQNAELAHALTEAIVKRPPTPRRWWRIFGRT